MFSLSNKFRLHLTKVNVDLMNLLLMHVQLIINHNANFTHHILFFVFQVNSCLLEERNAFVLIRLVLGSKLI